MIVQIVNINCVLLFKFVSPYVTDCKGNFISRYFNENPFSLYDVHYNTVDGLLSLSGVLSSLADIMEAYR